MAKPAIFANRLNRIAAWLLMPAIILSMITGYGMVKGWLPRDTTMFIHTRVLPIPLGLVFIYHSSYAVFLFAKRHKLPNAIGGTLTTVYALITTLGLLLANQITEALPSPSKPMPNPPSSPSKLEEKQLKKYTLEELREYNGRDGKPAYIGMNGYVYDVSKLFRGGVHNGCIAGRDVTRVFPHPVSRLKMFPKVGTLVSE